MSENKKNDRPNNGARRRESQTANKKTGGPEVGIIFLVGRTLLIHSTPVLEASTYGDFKIEEKDHLQFWNELQRAKAVPRIEYDETARGRCTLDWRARVFILSLDKCILRRKGLVARIVKRLHLPRTRLHTSEDPHYRCPRCLRGIRSFSEL